ncbi:MAG: RNA-binding protein [Gammaproteobacteria bacterium]|nr:RNA-binding protein [Gammaproteobacteria bacterium]MDH5594012.1 RNA-binding protein [Gammaproteobacteria bacterium]MDH5614518.1 RNA-binding protein [Gammaproteobacteria bacterium]
MKTIFVGNLAFKARRDELSKLFSEYGQVNSVRIMTDRETRRPRGFGFIEMNSSDAKAAIKALDGYEFMGRDLKVNEANERNAN